MFDTPLAQLTNLTSRQKAVLKRGELVRFYEVACEGGEGVEGGRRKGGELVS